MPGEECYGAGEPLLWTPAPPDAVERDGSGPLGFPYDLQQVNAPIGGQPQHCWSRRVAPEDVRDDMDANRCPNEVPADDALGLCPIHRQEILG